MADWAGLYRDNVLSLCTLAGGLTDEDLGTTVPGTPAWTVHDVLAHLAGASTDLATGRMDGAPGPEWTARQVSERLGLTVDELTQELREHEETVAAAVADQSGPSMVWGTVVHHADLYEALSLGMLAESLWQPVLEAAAPRVLDELPVTVIADGSVYGAGGDQVEVPAYELFRALFSRRSRAQMRSWGAPALDPVQLDGICIFGPRDDDQPVPA
jgi:mycothiol maleylpyruvate isomerase-like protein